MAKENSVSWNLRSSCAIFS